MVESPPQKNDEQYPLLKVETGGGDIGRTTAPATPPAPGWNVTCSTRRSWLDRWPDVVKSDSSITSDVKTRLGLDRWPELFSACWMSGMLLGLFFLIMYGLGLGVIRRQPIFLMNYNGSKPGSEVYYHHIVQWKEPIPFGYFSEYLSKMASTYTFLHHNIIFLLDDTSQKTYRSIRDLTWPFRDNGRFKDNSGRFEDNSHRNLNDFLLKYSNVNVTIMSLSKYMASTPLRYEWRNIPTANLLFYARVFSVWKTGGIGIDLSVYNNKFIKHEPMDRTGSKILAIFKQHNNGINTDEYSNALSNIDRDNDRDEQNELVYFFNGLMDQLLKETQAFFNHSYLFSHDLPKKVTIAPEPTVQKKRLEISKITTGSSKLDDIKLEKVKRINTTDKPIRYSTKRVTPIKKSTNRTEEYKSVTLNSTGKLEKDNYKINNRSLSLEITVNKNNSTVKPKILVVYDYALFWDNLGSYFMQPNTPVLQNSESSYSFNRAKPPAYLLSLTADGSFIAASWNQHPFLAHIITAGCQRLPPEYAIQDAVINRCSSFIWDDVYCNYVYHI